MEKSSQPCKEVHRSRLKISHILKTGDYRALHWTHLFETLRHTVDAIYEICQVDRSVIECKEAIMILENYTKDFVALIEFLNAEDAWEHSERPTSIAWEIRKTAGFSGKMFSRMDVNSCCSSHNQSAEITASLPLGESELKETQANDKSFIEQNKSDGDLKSELQNKEYENAEVLRINKEDGLTVISDEDPMLQAAGSAEDGWKLVTYAKNRNRPANQLRLAKFNSPPFEPLRSPCALISNTSNITSTPIGQTRTRPFFPKSATEIRQTKASLAKMEHNRQYLAEQRRKEVDEWTKSVRNRLPSGLSSPHASSASLPSLTFNFHAALPYQKLGLNFNDSPAGKRLSPGVRLKNLRFMNGKAGRKNRFRSYQSMESLCSLESIKEAEDESNAAIICQNDDSQAADTDTVGRNNESSVLIITLDDISLSCDAQATPQNVSEAAEQGESEEENEEDRRTWQHLTEEEESLAQEEENLQKEIEEERKSIDLEVSRRRRASVDDEAGELSDDEKKDETKKAIESSNEYQISVQLEAKPMTWQELVSRWKAEFPSSSICLSDICQADLSEIRMPGQVAQMHEKLSSPSRKRNNIDDTIRKQEERLTKAEELRHKLLKEQQNRLSKLFRRVDEVRAQKASLLEKKRILTEKRLDRATENRSHQLLAKVKKAKDEDEKVQEIAFINSLEADNKRHDVYIKQQDHEHRLQTLHEERQRKVEEKAAREQAVEERRKAVEEERQTKVRELAERTRRRQEQIDQQRSEQELCRQQAAKEKARERSERIAERRAARQANTDELLQRIQQKQEDSLRRHEENLEMIKQRANEMSNLRAHNALPNEVTTPSTVLQNGALNSGDESVEKKKDTILSPIQEINQPDSVLIDKDVEKSQASLKKRQKIKQKFIAKYKDYLQHVKYSEERDRTNALNNAYSNPKLHKIDRDIEKVFTDCGIEKQWLPNNVLVLERSLNEISRIFRTSQALANDQELFYNLKSRDDLLKLFSLLEKDDINNFPLPVRCVTNVATVLQLSIHRNDRLTLCVLYHGQILLFANALAAQLKVLSCASLTPSSNNRNSSLTLLHLINDLLTTLCSIDVDSNKEMLDNQFCGLAQFSVRNMLLISYVVACRCIDYMERIIKQASVVDSVTGEISVLIVEVVRFCCLSTRLLSFSLHFGRLKENSTQLLENFRETELCSIVSFLYSLLLSPYNLDSNLTRSELPEEHSRLVIACLDFLNQLAVLDTQYFQNVLSGDRMSLEFRHIASFLICFSNKQNMPDILQRIIIAVGMFTRCNQANQNYVHTGTQPSILQQLCVLPFAYFSDPHLCNILLPTLICCCYNNPDVRRVLEEELSGQLLADFIEDFLDNESSLPLKWDDEMDFRNRFPRAEFENAKEFFASKTFD